MKDRAEKIKDAIIEEFGSVEDCCTTANAVFWKLYENEYDIRRIQGTVTETIDGETIETDHEWLMVDGEFLDITAEQFDESAEYSGEEVDFHYLNRTEMEEIEKILVILARD